MRKQNFVLLLVLSAALMLGTAAAAAELVPGVTVAEDANSITGYTATFVYQNAAAKTVDLRGSFSFYWEGAKLGVLAPEYFTAAEWKPGMFKATASDLVATEPMTKVDGTDYWTVSIPLPSGHYTYNYQVDGAEPITDPVNPPLASTVPSGGKSLFSLLDVPYSERQGGSVDFSFLLPRTDGKAGQLTFVEYQDVNGNAAPLVVYLPYGYDPERAEAYNVLYLCHGGSSNELEWFGSGNADHIFDNLIADGAVEPTIIVAMSNYTQYAWERDVVTKNIIEYIIPFMEENYNVGTEPANRAMAGLSAGGRATSRMYYAYPDQFGYLGIYSGFDNTVNIGNLSRDKAQRDKLRFPKLMLGGGMYDFGIWAGRMDFGLPYLEAQLGDLEIPFDYYVVKGGHDWGVWEQLIKVFATDYLWK